MRKNVRSNFFCQLISKEGLKADSRRVCTILDISNPKDLSEVITFLKC